jgi:biopolymer transport protein TolR
VADFDTKGNKRGGGIYDVNMTPLIDVSLVLVVILMVAMPMILQSGIAVKNASAKGRSAREQARVERIDVAVISEDSVLVNHQAIGREHLRGALAPLVAASSNGIVVISCADQVTHGTFVDVLDEAKGSGAAQIAVLED